MGLALWKSSPKLTLVERLTDMTHYTEFKQLVYAISALQTEKGFRSLAVLSALQGEGKTLFCAALATAYAEICQTRVLVVDTTTYHHPKSLDLRQCLNSTSSMIDFLPLEKGKITTFGSTRRHDGDAPVSSHPNVSVSSETDQSIIRQVAEEGAKQHSLVLLDTVPLGAKNRNNIDPLLVARLADASLLVVSPKLLNSPNLSETLKVLDDPALHLIGLVSNEEHAS